MNFLKNKNEQTLSSREIAKDTGKAHHHVMRDIRNMEDAWINVNGTKFGLVDYIDNKGQKRPEYHLTKKETLYIATKYNDVVRAKLINRWEELEQQVQNNQFQIPTTLSGALLLASQQAEQIEQQQLLLTEQTKQIEEKEKQVYQSQLIYKKLQNTITDQAPKVVFAEAIVSAETDVQIGQLAKVISQATSKSIGQNKLFSILRDNGYLLSRREQYNLPAQTYIDRGIFKIKYSTYNDTYKKATRINATCMVTPLGQEYFVNKFVKKYKN
ncbi:MULTISPECIES: phage regulatory protein/antirepressor Ant [Sphingobacterium]|uniref:phage regulatory protein/antirepressor Ant n=1 Tax=Sphingobacterium TaxID=28453 RepID=UPI00257CE28E|nr:MULTISPECIES: phage regulatory protein/antirepressor Ant [Sphingobacterium]